MPALLHYPPRRWFPKRDPFELLQKNPALLNQIEEADQEADPTYGELWEMLYVQTWGLVLPGLCSHMFMCAMGWGTGVETGTGRACQVVALRGARFCGWSLSLAYYAGVCEGDVCCGKAWG